LFPAAAAAGADLGIVFDTDVDRSATDVSRSLLLVLLLLPAAAAACCLPLLLQVLTWALCLTRTLTAAPLWMVTALPSTATGSSHSWQPSCCR
jgi:hypothetical protein